jgi:cation transport ATPase
MDEDQYQDIEYTNITNQCNYCILSSFIFLTNVLAGLYFKQYLYAFLFLLLTLTSIIHHSSKTKLTNLLDKIALYCIIFYGGYKFYEHYTNTTKTSQFDIKTITKYVLIVATFLSVVYLYSYGYLTNNYVFHSEYKTSQLYHCLMHIISSLGHHIIIAL